MPREPRDLELSDEALLERALREMLEAPASSGKALEAKASAARQFAALKGIGQGAGAASGGEAVPDPMEDLNDEVGERRRRRATGVR